MTYNSTPLDFRPWLTGIGLLGVGNIFLFMLRFLFGSTAFAFVSSPKAFKVLPAQSWGGKISMVGVGVEGRGKF